MKKQLILSLLCLMYLSSRAVGQWQMYLSYPTVDMICQSSNRVYAMGGGSLYSLDKNDKEIETFSILNGLTGRDISSIAFDEENGQLMVVYTNSGIDFITGKGTFAMNDLRDKDMAGSKQINDIFFHKNTIYLSSDFGVLKMNAKKMEISDTYRPSFAEEELIISSTVVRKDSLYALTPYKIFKAPLSDKMLVSPDRWHTQPTTQLFGKNSKLVTFEDTLFLLKENGDLYKMNENNTFSLFKNNVGGMCVSQGKLNIWQVETTISENESIPNKTTSTLLAYTTLAKEPIALDVNIEVRQALYNASQKSFLVASKSNGLTWHNINDGAMFHYNVNGPGSKSSYVMKFSNGRLFVIATCLRADGVMSGEDTPGYIMIYDGKNWINYNASVIPEGNHPFEGLLDIDIDPKDNQHFYVGSFNIGGLYEFRNDRFYKRWNSLNSVIESPMSGIDSYQVIDAVKVDDNGDVWILQTLATNPLKVMHPDGTWESCKFSAISGEAVLRRNLRDVNNYRWIVSPRTGVVHVYDIAKKTGVKHTSFVDQDGKSFNTQRIRAIAFDKVDPQRVWLGTLSGPVIIPNAKQIFSSNRINRIKIPRNDGTGLADYLLGNEAINDIFVDGENRKWLATRTSGVYLVSADGTETIEHFTTKNSPLLADNVFSIAINDKTGEVFFCTEAGICSYMGDASTPAESFSEIHAYPNPVREDYEGVVAITNLMENTNVKITNVAGDLIYETMSRGGMATWDCTDKTGHRVPSGVYLALCRAGNGKSSICKIVVMGK